MRDGVAWPVVFAVIANCRLCDLAVEWMDSGVKISGAAQGRLFSGKSCPASCCSLLAGGAAAF